MRRKSLNFASILLALAGIAIGAVIVAVKSENDRRSGPVHHFPVLPGETFLAEDRAITITREVMSRDGLVESRWMIVPDDRSKAPDGRPDRYLFRNGQNLNRGMIHFHLDGARMSDRLVTIEWGNGEITAQGTFGK
jgi:hypothetical protein